jgi:hypothetical protein
LGFKDILLRLGQRVKKFSLGDFVLNRELRFMHPNQEGDLAEANRPGLEQRGGE